MGGPNGGVVENGGGACKNSWRLARGKRFPARFWWLLWGEVYPGDAAVPGGGKSRKLTAGGRPLTLGCAGGAVRSVLGLSRSVDKVLLVANAQLEVMQGAANDDVGAVIKRLERRYVAVTPHEHRRCVGEVVGQLRRRAAAVLCLVEVCAAALSVLENCSRKIFEVNSGESKNWPGKMSGEPTRST